MIQIKTLSITIPKRYDNNISHGNALSLGIAAVCRATQQFNLAASNVSEAITQILRAFSLSIGSAHCVEDIFDVTISQINFAGETVALTIPGLIGMSTIYDTDSGGLRTLIQIGLYAETI